MARRASMRKARQCTSEGLKQLLEVLDYADKSGWRTKTKVAATKSGET